MPTGIALQDARTRLFSAADNVLLRDGANALTSRAVTDELGVAKGVLHRHFADFDTFLADLVLAHTDALANVADQLHRRTGDGTIVANLRYALTSIFDPLGLAMIRLVISRDAVRDLLRSSGSRGFPYLGRASEVLTDYLVAEREGGRLLTDADPQSLALTLIGTGHLLFAGESGTSPNPDAVDEAIASILR